MGFLVVDISVVAERKAFNQLETRVMASHSAVSSSRTRRSRLLPVNASISLEKSRARPIDNNLKSTCLLQSEKIETYEASDE
jgi:hypothetical protein